MVRDARSPGHVFYDRLQEVLVGAGFDGFVEEACRAFYAKTMGHPRVPPSQYFRMHMVGYFEGIDSERGIEWRCSNSFSLREFLLAWRQPTGFRTIPGCRPIATAKLQSNLHAPSTQISPTSSRADEV